MVDLLTDMHGTERVSRSVPDSTDGTDQIQRKTDTVSLIATFDFSWPMAHKSTAAVAAA